MGSSPLDGVRYRRASVRIQNGGLFLSIENPGDGLQGSVHLVLKGFNGISMDCQTTEAPLDRGITSFACSFRNAMQRQVQVLIALVFRHLWAKPERRFECQALLHVSELNFSYYEPSQLASIHIEFNQSPHMID